jgi:hypothetical protein
MLSILLLALADAPAFTVPDKNSSLEAQFDYAAKCRVHSVLFGATGKTAQDFAIADKLKAYWYKESDRLGKKLGLKGDALAFRYLVYPITADMELLVSCAKNSKGVFKK